MEKTHSVLSIQFRVNRIYGYLRDKINAKPWLDIAAISIQLEVIEVVT